MAEPPERTGTNNAMTEYYSGVGTTDFEYDDGWDSGHTDISSSNYLIALCPVYLDEPSNQNHLLNNYTDQF